jgi:hypothetical protein
MSVRIRFAADNLSQAPSFAIKLRSVLAAGRTKPVSQAGRYMAWNEEASKYTDKRGV